MAIVKNSYNELMPCTKQELDEIHKKFCLEMVNASKQERFEFYKKLGIQQDPSLSPRKDDEHHHE